MVSASGRENELEPLSIGFYSLPYCYEMNDFTFRESDRQLLDFFPKYEQLSCYQNRYTILNELPLKSRNQFSIQNRSRMRFLEGDFEAI